MAELVRQVKGLGDRFLALSLRLSEATWAAWGRVTRPLHPTHPPVPQVPAGAPPRGSKVGPTPRCFFLFRQQLS